MPRYAYTCEHCKATHIEIRRISDRNNLATCACGLPAERDIGAEGCKSDNVEYDHEILSTRMGVSPSQVAEHRKRFPNIPITDTGEIRVASGAEERRIDKELASAFRRE